MEQLNTLHPLEVRLLRAVDADHIIIPQAIMDRLGFNQGQVNQALSWLEAKELIAEHERQTVTTYELTDRGREFRANGTPEERILALLAEAGALRIPEISDRLGLANKDVGSAFGALSKSGAVAMDDEKRLALADRSRATQTAAVRALLDRSGDDGVLADRKSVV